MTTSTQVLGVIPCRVCGYNWFMPTNRFGELNTQPLYNATGRLERGESVPRQEWTSPNAGVSKNFGGNPYPNQNPSPLSGIANLANPWNWNSPFRGQRRGRGGSGGGDSSGGEAGSGTNIIVNFPQQQNAQFATQSQFDQSAQGTLPAPGAPIKQPRTEEQKAATRAKRAEKKAANPAYGTKNPNRTEAPKKPRQPKAATPAGPVAQNNQASANQTYTPQNNANIGGGQPGAGFLQVNGVSGGIGNIKR